MLCDVHESTLQELNERRLTMVEGSVFMERNLLRVRTSEAQAVMVLADRFSGATAQEDLDVQFRVWALKSYTKSVPLYVQVQTDKSKDNVARHTSL